MAVYLRAKFEVSNIILTGFRLEGEGKGEGGRGNSPRLGLTLGEGFICSLHL